MNLLARMVCVMWVTHFFAVTTEAQTTFAWASAKQFSSENMTNVHQCVAFLTRIQDSLSAKNPVAEDTLPAFGVSRDDTLSTVVVERATQCSVRFPVNAIRPTELWSAMRLYLMAGRDQDAETLVRRRIAETADSSSLYRLMVHDTAVSLYMGAVPPRVANTESLVADGLRLGASAPFAYRLELLLKPSLALHRMGDSVGEQRYSKLFLEQIQNATEQDKRSDVYGFAAMMGLNMKMQIDRQVMIDSLLRGTEAYVAWQRANWKQLSGEEIGRFPIGKLAPKLEGDFWFPATASQEDRPRKGRVSLVVFLDNDSKTGGNNRWDRIKCYVMLRRITDRFPSAEITLVSQTAGYFDMAAPPNPDEEAQALQVHWHTSFRVPGTLTVTNTPFWRLQSPDTRRIDQEIPNIKNYRFGDTYTSLDRWVFLIDSNGIIIYSDELRDSNEKRLTDVMDALVKREGGPNAR